MQVATGIEMLEITAVTLGRATTICPTLIFDNEQAILIDTGHPGQLGLVRQAVEQAGVPFAHVTQVILTHHDIDHIGSLPALVQERGSAIEVLASAGERPYIEGERRPIKLTPETIERAVASLPADLPAATRQAFRAALENPPKARVDRVLADGEELPDCGGLVVVVTPGHTPGHTCLYHRASRTLIAGDALTARDGELFGPNPAATADLAQATASLRKLAAYDIAAVICYHGGLYRGQANARIAGLGEGR